MFVLVRGAQRGRLGIKGYTRDECRPVDGDELCTPLTWKEHETADCKNAMLRIYLTDAKLYGYDWR